MLQQDDQGWNRYADTSTIPSNRSEIGCVELCNFHFCCAFIFCPELLDNDILGRERQPTMSSPEPTLLLSCGTANKNLNFLVRPNI